MRHTRVLDILREVTEAARRHPEVTAWWYAPARRLRLQGELPLGVPEGAGIELIVELDSSRPASLEAIAATLSGRLAGRSVAVRLHRGAAEGRRLFRLVSPPSRARDAAQPEHAERVGRKLV